MLFSELTDALGYSQSPLYREDNGEGLVAPEDQHWLRSARRAKAKGTYFFKATPDTDLTSTSVRPAVQVAEADTPEQAREIHRKLWNQGIHPFLVVLLPGQVRVYTGFAYDPAKEEVGAVTWPVPTEGGVRLVLEALSAFTADAIDRGEIWERNAAHLGSEQRVDTTLLKNLRSLAGALEARFALPRDTCHALIGKFVYLSYLRARDIVSDKWLRDDVGIDPATIFNGEVFAPDITLLGFRKLVAAIEKRFNGQLFPIAWGSRSAPKSAAVQLVARVFAGEEAAGQMHLGFRAYDFASIPVEFLSSIYEQFIHRSDKEGEERTKNASDPEKRGAHYTPEPLAEYLVSEVNAVRTLQPGMRVLDPCCGSGVFLVVAFRRLVEMRCRQEGRDNLNASQLRELLTSSIYAVERNRIACQIAGFSLILAMLGYVDPPELHRNKAFKFPTLVRNNLFDEDFFNEQGRFWRQIVSPEGKGIRFDAILGNPPWVELDKDDPDSAHLIAWSKAHAKDYALARARTGEAFAWRVMDCLAEEGAVGLILHAKTLTNDHLEGWRKQFFSRLRVRRVTNFANLAYIIFASAQAPCMTLVYTAPKMDEAEGGILHFGPFVANQRVTVPKRGGKRRAWTIGFSESEIKVVPRSQAASGKASVWKQSLWAGPRDEMALRRLQAVFSTTLGGIAEARNWKIALGLQLRQDEGSDEDPNEEILDKEGRNVLEGLELLDHKALVAGKRNLTIDSRFLIENTLGIFVRVRGGTKGVHLSRGPRLFLWNDFAAYTDQPFIIRHSKVGLAGGTAEEMKAVAAIWNSSYASYLLFFVLSSEWGIDRSLIDKGDAENLPFPEWTPERQQGLCAAWEEAAALERQGADFSEVKRLLDQRVARVLGIPASVALVVGEFFRVRYQLNKGKNPPALRHRPDEAELILYATRLRDDLDGFLANQTHHRVAVRHSGRGIAVSVTLTDRPQAIPIEVVPANGEEAETLNTLLAAAEHKHCQWVYVRRSVRLLDGDTIHLVKPPRRLEWTETQAMLDADDVIAEAVESSRRA